MPKVKYILWTHAGYYALSDNGTILYDSERNYRSYNGQWRIVGIGKRHHSNTLVSLSDASNGVNIGQGWIHDLDHGTHRIWGMPKSHRCTRVVLASDDYQIPSSTLK